MTEMQLRQSVVAQAKYWLGRKEADMSHRVIIDVYNSIVPLPRGYRMTYSDPWCAAFVSAVAQACGLTDIIYPECACDPMIALYKAAGRWCEDDAYRPNPGDVILYDWQDSGVGDNQGSSDHVGLVVGVDGNTITIIEGNCADAVCYQYRQVDGRYIRGYGLPDYASVADGEDPSTPPDGDPQDDNVDNSLSQPSADSSLPEGACTVTLPVLQIGDEGEAVRAAQMLLKGRGFSVGWYGCDGDFGRATESAVGKFQRDRELECDGIIGPETWTRLIVDGR